MNNIRRGRPLRAAGLALLLGLALSVTGNAAEPIRRKSFIKTEQTLSPARQAIGPIAAPAINRFLKTHLFGDIFNRDNLHWQSRELATVAVLAALSGVDSQLQSHVGISLNVGVSEPQLRQFIRVLAERVDAATAQRAQAALDNPLDK